ncbi:MAG TPA: peptidylprolyl isomerase [Puia sp.]|nr:peptidylprolyl isomerase [Puia sp.]
MNSAYIPKWMLEKQNADNSQLAAISFVNTPYFTVPDSSVKISDGEIQEYIDKHPDQYKQLESRSIAYVSFNAGPVAADSVRIKQSLVDLSQDFAKATDIEAFFGRVGQTQPAYLNAYVGKARIMVPNKDSIFALANGGLFGPYLDEGNYVIAKKIDEKVLPDSVRSRHILIATTDPRSGQVYNEDSVAKKRIDSIKTAIDHGANWDSLAAKLSMDPGSKDKGGDFGFKTSTDPIVPEYAEFIFSGKKGDKKIVKTVYGYHLIEITDQKNFEPAYKIAYLTRKIDASTETDNAALGLASQFAGQSRDGKAFDENAQKNHLQKMFAPDITPTQSSLPGLGVKRELVQWAYKADIGNVSEPYSIGDRYVVALLTEINKAGTMAPAKARNQVEPLLRNKKKAEVIVKKLGNPASLDAASTAAGQPVLRADSVLFATPFIPNAGQEGKVVGMAFDKQLAGKAISSAIPGNGGVFFIKVDNVGATSNPNADIQQQRFMQEQMQRQVVTARLLDALRKHATIKDFRSEFF